MNSMKDFYYTYLFIHLTTECKWQKENITIPKKEKNENEIERT
jgi:hypothetical protein